MVSRGAGGCDFVMPEPSVPQPGSVDAGVPAECDPDRPRAHRISPT